MAGTGPLDLNVLAEELLVACVASLNTLPFYDASLAGAPDRSFVSPGEPAADCCPQLTVHVRDIQEAPTNPGGMASGRRATFGRLNQPSLNMTLFRCVPVGEADLSGYTPPDAAVLESAAAQLNADGWALWNHLYNMIREETLFSLCGQVHWEGMRSLTPQGACAGWVTSFRVSLDGYEEIPSS